MRELKGLYVIADGSDLESDRLVDNVTEILAAGVKIIQYRDKTSNRAHRHAIASELKSLMHDHQGILIINDDVSLAKSVNADGVHLGREDCTIGEARKLLGPGKIIGVSCYNRLDNAIRAIDAGTDYVAFGSFARSPTKPDAPHAGIDLMIRAKRELHVPICAIGGLTKENITPLLQAGVDMIAMISAIFAAPSPQRAAREFCRMVRDNTVEIYKPS